MHDLKITLLAYLAQVVTHLSLSCCAGVGTTILSGLDAVNSTWSAYRGCIYVTTLPATAPETIKQLFFHGEMQLEARYPNVAGTRLDCHTRTPFTPEGKCTVISTWQKYTFPQQMHCVHANCKLSLELRGGPACNNDLQSADTSFETCVGFRKSPHSVEVNRVRNSA